MIFYELNTLKSPEGPQIGSRRFSANDDVEAVRSARAIDEGKPRELWCGTRKVMFFPASQAELA